MGDESRDLRKHCHHKLKYRYYIKVKKSGYTIFTTGQIPWQMFRRREWILSLWEYHTDLVQVLKNYLLIVTLSTGKEPVKSDSEFYKATFSLQEKRADHHYRQ